MSQVTEVVEEYLEGIYRLQEKSGVARTSDIVKMLQVVPGTVTNTVERLEKEGMLKHEPYRGVRLTDKGRRIAIDVIRRHRLSERLLTDFMHVDWDKAHDAACRLEHDITNDVVKKLEKALGHPKTCPHGNPIPTACGGIVEEKSEPLFSLKPRESGVIAKVIDETPEVLEYIASMGLLPGASIEIVEKAPFDGPVTVKVGGANHALSFSMASIIWVKKKVKG
jgi:DtxR family Mn-dependent transcriptional regulator